MSAIDNKQLMQDIFSELSKGNDKPFIEAMAEDMQWTWMGTGQWSKTFKGKPSVLNELWGAVKTTLTQQFKVVAHRFIAEGDYVVVEASGHNTTPEGRPYNNKYCWVCRIAEGKLQELHEYMDTELVTATFQTDGKF
jgi:ketosteroid isomerase-like protein